jgi:uncharacterized membrane protein YeiB
MWLGRLDWHEKKTKQQIFIAGLIIFSLIQCLRFVAKQPFFDAYWTNYIMAEYFPPYLPFVLVTMGFALMVIPICMMLGERFAKNPVILALQKTGQMTLTHYVSHLTLGMILFAFITGKQYTGLLEDEKPTEAIYILGYVVLYYLLSILFSIVWSKRFKNGPLETLMRKISG